MRQHDLLKEYVQMLVKSDITSLVVKGNGGIGKSYSIMSELESMGFTEGVNYIYVTGYVTPLQLYNIILRSTTLEAPKLLVFDDIDALVTNKISIALLKSALWEVRGKRIVSYHSSSSKIEGLPSIEFEGKICLVLNDLKQENAFGKPLLDRTIVFDMSLTHKEVIEYVDMILPDIKSPLKIEERKEIWKQIKKFSVNPRFSVRSVVKAFSFYKNNKKHWYPMFISSLSLTAEQKLYYEITAGGGAKALQAKQFAKLTGKSERAFYRQNK